MGHEKATDLWHDAQQQVPTLRAGGDNVAGKVQSGLRTPTAQGATSRVRHVPAPETERNARLVQALAVAQERLAECLQQATWDAELITHLRRQLE